jgi:hypothetical protein
MPIPRRFVFRGNASAFGGFVFRPEYEVYEVPGASSLDVVGGRSVAKLPAREWKFARYGGATTFAEGLFEEHRDAKPDRRTEDWNPRDEEMHPVTTVSSEVVKLAVGNEIPVSIDHLSAHLQSRSSSRSRETSVAIDPKRTFIQGISVAGHPLAVELDCQPFVDHVTVGALLKAMEDRDFASKHGHCFFLGDPAAAGWPRLRRLFSARTIYATIVRQIRWAGDPYPGSTISQNVVTIPRFGRVYFGEVLIDPDERRLTMVRFDLGSPDGGKASSGGVHSNGTWVP